MTATTATTEQVLDTITPVSQRRIPSRVDLDPNLDKLIREHGFIPSWQSIGENAQSVLHSDGLFPLRPEQIAEWDEDLASRLFGGEPGTRKLFVRDGFIRNVDCVLMVQRADQRERLMAEEDLRKAKQNATIAGDDLKELSAQLRELGVEVPEISSPSLAEQVFASKKPGRGGGRKQG